MKRLSVVALLALALFACEDKKPTGTAASASAAASGSAASAVASASASAVASASAAPAASASAAPTTASADPEAVPSQAEESMKAFKEIDKSNYKAELEKLDKEIASAK